ncbi:MAG: aspartate dehydrogenase domain-containing protein [Burkholderiales bacterium]
MKRIGLIGFGFIGAQVFERIRARRALGLEVAFVHNRGRSRLDALPRDLILDDLSDLSARTPDLVVEMAHPDYSRHWGERILALADYLPLSVTALADDALRTRLQLAAERASHRLLIPHGALLGTENLVEWRHMWKDVTITFRKHPRNLDFSASGIDGRKIERETVLYDGPVRGIASLYPRNVNTMVTCALATVGLDRCRARLIADPALQVAMLEVEAIGLDGGRVTMQKAQPALGVSGTEMFEAQWSSIVRAAAVREPLGFV